MVTLQDMTWDFRVNPASNLNQAGAKELEAVDSLPWAARDEPDVALEVKLWRSPERVMVPDTITDISNTFEEPQHPRQEG